MGPTVRKILDKRMAPEEALELDADRLVDKAELRNSFPEVYRG